MHSPCSPLNVSRFEYFQGVNASRKHTGLEHGWQQHCDGYTKIIGADRKSDFCMVSILWSRWPWEDGFPYEWSVYKCGSSLASHHPFGQSSVLCHRTSCSSSFGHVSVCELATTARHWSRILLDNFTIILQSLHLSLLYCCFWINNCLSKSIKWVWLRNWHSTCTLWWVWGGGALSDPPSIPAHLSS